jgi:hypothetical protein
LADKIITLAELLKMLEKHDHRELHVHHTWQPDHNTYFNRPDPLYWQAAMRRYHKENNGWDDIGQHVTLLPDGLFVTGRPFNKTPASIKGYNTGAFAVEMVGNFDIGKDVLEGWQRESIIGLARWFDQRGKYIRFHRENSSKTCPGSGISKEEFMREVKGDMALRKGDKGNDVKKLQQDLIKLGYNLDPYGADGSFGAKTETTVMKFQRDHGLEVDGKAGPKTQAKIAELLAALDAPKEDLRVKELQAQVAKLEAELAMYKQYFKLQEQLRNGV